MLSAGQFNFDFEYTDAYNGADIEKLIMDTLESYGLYALGCLVGADGPDDWGELSEYDMCQGGVDYFMVGPNARKISVRNVVGQALKTVGCKLWDGQYDSVEYDDSIIDDLSRWYGVSEDEIKDNLIEYGYIESDDDNEADFESSYMSAYYMEHPSEHPDRDWDFRRPLN